MLDASPWIDYANDSQQMPSSAPPMTAPFTPVRPSPTAPSAHPAGHGCYQRRRGADPLAMAASLALVALVGGVFATMSPVFVKKQSDAPTVVTLMSLPDEPPAAEVAPPPPEAAPPLPQSVVEAPLPIVQTVERPVIQAPALPVVADPAPPRPAPPAPPAARGPENLGEISARAISTKLPRYPAASRRGHEQGTVLLSVLVSTDGRVAEVSVARSSGFARLDKAALEAVREWRWSPVLRDGSPVMVRGMVSVGFDITRSGRGGGNDHRGRTPRQDREEGRDSADLQSI